MEVKDLVFWSEMGLKKREQDGKRRDEVWDEIRIGSKRVTSTGVMQARTSGVESGIGDSLLLRVMHERM